MASVISFFTCQTKYTGVVSFKKMHLYLKLGQDVELSVSTFAEMQKHVTV